MPSRIYILYYGKIECMQQEKKRDGKVRDGRLRKEEIRER